MKSFILLASLIFFQVCVDAQVQVYKFRNLSTQNGLAQGEVMCAYQDHEGFVWFGTSQGLNKYYGTGMRTFKGIKNDSSSLQSSYVTNIYEDKQNTLWICTGGKCNLSAYDRDKDIFIAKKTKELASAINNLFEDVEHRFWIGAKGLFEYDRKSGKLTRHLKEFGVSKIGFIGQYNSHEIILSVNDKKNGGILIYNPQSKQYKRICHESGSNPLLSDNFVTAASFDSKNNLWVGYEGGGLDCLDLVHHTVKNFKHSSTNVNSLAEDRVSSIVCSNDNKIFIGTYEKGMDIYDPVLNKFTHCRVGDSEFSLKSDVVKQIRKGKDGTIWICTWGGGVSIYDKRFDKFTAFKHEKGQNNVPIGTVTSFAEDKHNGIWVGYDGSGISNFNPNTGEFISYTGKPLSGNKVLSLMVDDEGFLWSGMWQPGADKFEIQGDKLKLKKAYQKFNALDDLSNCILSMHSDKEYIWFGSFHGLFRMGREDEKMEQVIFDKTKKTVDNGYLISSLHINSGNAVWASTTGNGLFKVDKKDLSSKRFFNAPSDSTTISDDLVNFVFTDSKKNIWVGTGLGVLNLFDSKTEKFTHFSQNDGLPDAQLKGVLEDGKGNLWVSSTAGIIKITPDWSNGKVSIKVRKFNESDGLQGEIFTSACFKSHNGIMYFGGQNGFNMFHPDSIKDNSSLPPVYITGFMIFNKEVQIGAEGSPLKKDISQTNEIILTHDQQLFTFRFIALNYISSDKNQYAYMMEGFDKDWNYVGGRTEATYTNLDPGEYVFRVKAANNDGVWNETGTSIKVIILPPWWKTWWFRLFMGIFVVGSVVGYYSYRITSLRRQKIVLEQKVSERTLELSNANEELREKQEELQQQQDEILAQRDELEAKNEILQEKTNTIEKAFSTSKVISQFGQKVTSELKIDSINQMVHSYISSIMPADGFGIGIYFEKSKSIIFNHFIINKQLLSSFSISMDDQISYSAKSLRIKETIIDNALSDDYRAFIDLHILADSGFPVPLSTINVPLYNDKKDIGVLVVFAQNEKAYTSHDVTNLQTLASYIAIAFDNANAYRALHLKNESISSSIRYGLNIQNSILPDLNELDTFFEATILYRPKDIVSGDFYWFADLGEDGYFIAVVDCTGHGVPGAFMSLIGNRLLNEIVIEEKNYDTDSILCTLDLKIRQVLKQSETENKDGMDVCLCRFFVEPDKQPKLEFSGAKRDLYWLSKSNGLTVVNGDRKSIGGIKYRDTVSFTKKTIDIDHGDTFVLTTDGFVDQNNEQRKRFGTNQLLEILEGVGNDSLDNIKDCLKGSLLSHQKDEDQRDDITVLLVRPKKNVYS